MEANMSQEKGILITQPNTPIFFNASGSITLHLKNGSGGLVEIRRGPENTGIVMTVERGTLSVEECVGNLEVMILPKE